jgi:hypothetical protein
VPYTFEFVDRTEERCYEAELYRLKGELTLQQSEVQSQKKEKVNNTKIGSRKFLAPSP